MQKTSQFSSTNGAIIAKIENKRNENIKREKLKSTPCSRCSRFCSTSPFCIKYSLKDVKTTKCRFCKNNNFQLSSFY